MSLTDKIHRIRSEFVSAWNSFLRRRTAVFFTFFFPVIIVGIFGALIQTNPGGGLFSQPQGYYIPGYLAVVVLLTPLSRVGSTVTRHRSSRRFEKLATTPLTRFEWLASHTLVNVILISVASLILLGVLILITDANIILSPFLLIFVLLGVTMFCGVGAILGRIAKSQDGVIAASNAVGIPMLLLADTFVPPEKLPQSFRPLIDLLPLTYFSRGVRSITYTGRSADTDLLILLILTIIFFVIGGYLIPWTE